MDSTTYFLIGVLCGVFIGELWMGIWIVRNPDKVIELIGREPK